MYAHISNKHTLTGDGGDARARYHRVVCHTFACIMHTLAVGSARMRMRRMLADDAASLNGVDASEHTKRAHNTRFVYIHAPVMCNTRRPMARPGAGVSGRLFGRALMCAVDVAISLCILLILLTWPAPRTQSHGVCGRINIDQRG